MDLVFDIRGNLLPYNVVAIGLSDFKKTFVDSFDEQSSRHQIFQNYLDFLAAFKTVVSSDFKQWIDGSFVTNRVNPKDIDVVTLLDHQVASEKYTIIKSQLLNKEALKAYHIDPYLVRLYPEGHKYYAQTQSDKLYWRHLFGYTKKNRSKKRFPKGFVELTFNK